MTSSPQSLINIAAEAPGRIALRHGRAELSYGELDDRITRLAHHLTAIGVAPGATVALALGRSAAWIVAAQAVMRAGAAYVPMDLAWPEERMRFVVRDSGAAALIAATELVDRLALGIAAVDPCRDAVAIATAPPVALPEITPAMLAYVIYTSGSTGVPKGVEITHANLAHLIAWHVDRFCVTPADRATHVAGLAFDAAGWEIWPTLAAGASIALADEMVRTSPELLQRWLVAEGITLSFVPTALAVPLIAMPWPAETALRLLLTGGDALPSAPRPGLPFTLVNNYGPTECTVVATSGAVAAATTAVPSIGRAIAGALVYILDEHGAPVPPGTVGEITVGGGGVGRGYRNLPELTARHFVPDPFAAAPGARMYRTGDLGVELPDGQIAFRGRLDRQEKIRGQRVELDEINCVLNRHPSVSFAAVVTTLGADGEKQLVAHVLPAPGAQPSASELQEYLATVLPLYMVPAHFVRLGALPLTPNGKVNLTRLEPPTAANALLVEAVREPSSPVEETLLSMVRELLGTAEVSVEDDFFLLGGHSLLGTQLVLRIRSAFGVGLTLRDLFEAATVERLSLKVEDMLLAEIDAMSEEDAVRQTAGS